MNIYGVQQLNWKSNVKDHETCNVWNSHGISFDHMHHTKINLWRFSLMSCICPSWMWNTYIYYSQNDDYRNAKFKTYWHMQIRLQINSVSMNYVFCVVGRKILLYWWLSLKSGELILRCGNRNQMTGVVAYQPSQICTYHLCTYHLYVNPDKAKITMNIIEYL